MDPFGLERFVEAQDHGLSGVLLELRQARKTSHWMWSIFGGTDALKLRSSITLFLRAAPDEPRWQQLLERYDAGVPDARTDQLLGLA